MNKPNSEEKRKKVYKKVKVAMPHCDVCGEMLGGNGSELLPYNCQCGTWGIHNDWIENTYYYFIKHD